MARRFSHALLFAAVGLIAIPALVHTLFEGAYMPPDAGTFWIGPISTTLPYAGLALLFLAHCVTLNLRSWRPAYAGALAAWCCMMAFTVFLISQPPGPKTSSTMAIAVGLTPFFYIPILALPYFAGTLFGWLWTKKHAPGGA